MHSPKEQPTSRTVCWETLINLPFQLTTRIRQAMYATPIALVNVPALELVIP